MPDLSQITIPVKDLTTGNVTNQTFGLKGDTTAYSTGDSASTTVNDTDYIPMSESGGTRKKALWSTVVDKIKTALGIASSGSTYLKKDGTWGTPTNTTYTFATGDSNGTIKVTPSGGSAQNVSVKGLNSGAYIEADKDSTNNTLVRRADVDAGINVGRISCSKGATFGSKVIIDVGTANLNDLELGSETTGHHGTLAIYGNSTKFVAIKESAVTLNGSRTLSVPNETGVIQVTSPSSRRVKKNIHAMTEEEAKKLLDVDVVKFDYIGDWCGGKKNQSGVIAEDTIEIIPEAVQICDNYDPNQAVDEENNIPPNVDYRKFIPYLIKMVQMQQAEIDELKSFIK